MKLYSASDPQPRAASTFLDLSVLVLFVVRMNLCKIFERFSFIM